MNENIYILDSEASEDPELAGFFSKLIKAGKQAITPPAKVRSALKKKMRKVAKKLKPSKKIRDFVKKAKPIVKKAGYVYLKTGEALAPKVFDAFFPGSSALVKPAYAGLNKALESAGVIENISASGSPEAQEKIAGALSVAGSLIAGGGSGEFESNTDIVNKLVALKSSTKPTDHIGTAIALGKSLGFTSDQVADVLSKNEVKINDKIFNTALFKLGTKPDYNVGLIKTPEELKMIEPYVMTKQGKAPVFKFYDPSYFELGADSELELKFLSGLVEKAKGIVGSGTTAVKETVAKVFPSAEEKEQAKQTELLEKKTLLVKNIQTLENSLNAIKKEYAIKKRSLSPEDLKQIEGDIQYVSDNLAKMKDELAKMSDLNYGGDPDLAIAPLVVLGIAGAVAYLGAKIVDTVKMHKVLARDKLILSQTEGALTPAQASAIVGRPVVTSRRETEVKGRFELPGALPIALIVAGGGLIYFILSRKKRRRGRR